MLIEKGYKHVKIDLKKDIFIAECRCMIVNGPYGTSVGIFLDQSPPEVRKRFEKVERFVRGECMSKQDEGFSWHKNLRDFDADDVAIIKNSVVWGKIPRSVVRDLPLRQMMTAQIVFRLGHVFWNEHRICVICLVNDIRKMRVNSMEKVEKVDSQFDEWETVNHVEDL